jgi:hypothetical protein
MNIDISQIDAENIDVHEKQIGSETVFLVHGRVSTNWTQDNLIFRSSVWDKNGNLISASFKKFFNWDERPDLNPKPYSISGCQLIEKIDGSTLIVSKFKDNLITRTRDTVDASFCDNSNEIEFFKMKYPKAFDVCQECSFIFEWVSPKHPIIINYNQPDIYLTAVIDHSDYSMWSQDKLDDLALLLGVKRPRVFKFSTINEMIDAIREFKGIEGICVYYNHGQDIRKIKSAEYLILHHFKSDLSLGSVLDMYLRYGMPKYNVFIESIAKEFDWECAQYVKGLASKVCDASIEVNNIIDSMKKFADSVRGIVRKEAAAQIISSFGKTSRSSFVFGFLDNKQLDNDALKKLYFQVLK